MLSVRIAALVAVTVVAGNWVLAPFISARHEHVWCAEHHRFEHAHPQDHPAESAEAESRVPGFGRLDEAPEPAAHEECRFLAHLNQSSHAPSSFIAATMPPAAMVGELPAGTSDHPAQPILSLAPKSSPPA